MAKRTKKPVKKSQRSVYLADTMWDTIDKVAERDKRSSNKVIEIILEKEI